MVGFPAKSPKTVEEELAPVEFIDQDSSKVKAFKDTLDFPSIDSFLDFDSCNWLGNNRNIEEFSIEDKDFDFFEDQMEVGQESPENQTLVMSESIEVKSELCGEIPENNGVSLVMSESMVEVKPEPCSVMSEEIGGVKSESKLCDDMSTNCEEAVKESEPVVSDNSGPMEGETVSVGKDLAASIEVELEKVSLTMDDDEKSGEGKGKTDSGESESETSSSSSSSGSDSSSSEEEEESDEEEESEEEEDKKIEDRIVIGKEDGVAGDLEEGEIDSVDAEHEVEDDDDDDEEDDDDEVNEMIAWSNDEDDDLGLQTKEPIRSKNELKELPPVPPVNVTLEPHHATLPVGVVLSVMSTQVIVEGMEKHSPLTEGSILWITERRTPLGLVDEIFGPVKCPYYIVRFNSESDVPEGVCQGTPVSFVADFAQHILNIKEMQKKGYDASGDNDEEISEELEFSDDEKEAEYRRLQKMEKRGMMNDQNTSNTRNKKKKNRDLGRHTNSFSGDGSSNRSDPQMGGPVSNHQPRPQMDGFPPNGGAWRPQNNQQNPYQLPPIPNQMGMPNLGPMQLPLMAMQNQMMFQPQFNGGQMPMPGGPGDLNFFPGQASAPWQALVGQNCFNQQPFGMGRGIQHPQLPNELNFNMFASQGFPMPHPQMQQQRPPSPMNQQFQMQPQFQPRPQSPMNPQFQMVNRPPQSPMNPQFQMQPQSETRPQSQSPTNPQSPMQPQSQGFSNGQSSERGRGNRGRGPRGRGRGRGRFGSGRGRGVRGRGRQQSE